MRINSLSCFQKIKDDGILWKVNFVRFHQYFIDEVSTHKIKKYNVNTLKVQRSYF